MEYGTFAVESTPHKAMKLIKELSVIFAVLLYTVAITGSCSDEDYTPSRISIHSSYKSANEPHDTGVYPNDTILFSGDDIKWYDESTEELRFNDTDALMAFRENWTKYDYATFYLDGKKLFTVAITESQMPLTYDDLTLIDNGYKYFLSHGYPTSAYASPYKAEKNAAAWNVFIKQLMAEGRYRKSNK